MNLKVIIFNVSMDISNTCEEFIGKYALKKYDIKYH